MSVKIGVVCEGITDFQVLKHLTECYLRDCEAYVIPLKPKVKPDGSQDGFGSWTGVLDYISDSDGMLTEAFKEDCNYVIVHIDTDVCEQFGIEKGQKDDITIHQEVLNNLVSRIPDEFDLTRLIFAIAINETECWLIPFLSTNKKECSRTNSCVNAVNRLYKDGGFIDSANKNAPGARKVYDKILRRKRKAKDIKDISRHNAGFAFFINTLDRLVHRLQQESEE